MKCLLYLENSILKVLVQRVITSGEFVMYELMNIQWIHEAVCLAKGRPKFDLISPWLDLQNKFRDVEEAYRNNGEKELKVR